MHHSILQLGINNNVERPGFNPPDGTSQCQNQVFYPPMAMQAGNVVQHTCPKGREYPSSSHCPSDILNSLNQHLIPISNRTTEIEATPSNGHGVGDTNTTTANRLFSNSNINTKAIVASTSRDVTMDIDHSEYKNTSTDVTMEIDHTEHALVDHTTTCKDEKDAIVLQHVVDLGKIGIPKSRKTKNLEQQIMLERKLPELEDELNLANDELIRLRKQTARFLKEKQTFASKMAAKDRETSIMMDAARDEREEWEDKYAKVERDVSLKKAALDRLEIQRQRELQALEQQKNREKMDLEIKLEKALTDAEDAKARLALIDPTGLKSFRIDRQSAPKMVGLELNNCTNNPTPTVFGGAAASAVGQGVAQRYLNILVIFD